MDCALELKSSFGSRSIGIRQVYKWSNFHRFHPVKKLVSKGRAYTHPQLCDRPHTLRHAHCWAKQPRRLGRKRRNRMMYFLARARY